MMSAARGVAWIGITLVIVFVSAHLLRVARPLEELKFLIGVVVIGGAWETALVFCGVLDYPASPGIGRSAPLWILALWGSFAAQFNTTYRWLKPRIPVAALLGAVAGPLSFRAGAALGALRFANPWQAAAVLAIGWAVLLPIMALMARRWDGVTA